MTHTTSHSSKLCYYENLIYNGGKKRWYCNENYETLNYHRNNYGSMGEKTLVLWKKLWNFDLLLKKTYGTMKKNYGTMEKTTVLK